MKVNATFRKVQRRFICSVYEILSCISKCKLSTAFNKQNTSILSVTQNVIIFAKLTCLKRGHISLNRDFHFILKDIKTLAFPLNEQSLIIRLMVLVR